MVSENRQSQAFTYDWLSFTCPSDNGLYIENSIPLGAELGDPDSDAKHGYTRSRRFESGAVIMWSAERTDMGVHVVLSGSALRWIGLNGMDCLKVLYWAKKLGGRVSRIDMAVDVTNSGLTLAMLRKENRNPYKGKGRTPKYTPVGDDEDGWTLYIGSRTSDKFLRVYDKAKEQGDKTADWKRIEIECKGMVAHYVGDTLASATLNEAYTLASTLIRTMVDYPLICWKQALSSEVVGLSLPKKTERDTIGWLVSACAPALARVISEKPSEDVLGLFWEALQRELRARNYEIE